ncbi:helix-turn-helix transcriptional regulator [Azohydromonas aeria]|uniref:helix-turn-helix transcriptional regulator n=1 Tax=Azohydromonas aeria TaxID=2590212 RepID=UPI0012F82191|nr:helix-turn-helix transcriptional regulator [Azohydromonas aeria]
MLTLRLRPAFNAAVCRIRKRLLDRGVTGRVEEDGLQRLDDGLSASTIRLVMPAPTDCVLDGEAAIAWLQCFEALGRGDLRWARECLQVCSANLQASPSVAVRFMRPYVRVAACELALMQGAWVQAAKSADDALAAALQAENQQVAWLAQLLRLRALEADGRIEDALRGWKALYAQDMMRSSALPCGPAVPWRMPAIGASGAGKLATASLGLTPAELAVLRLLCQGHTAPRIAALRGTSPGTVRIQLKALFSKTATGSQQELIARFASDPSLFPASSP